MGVTPNYGWPYPELSDPANVPLDLKELADAIDTTVKAHTSADVPIGAMTMWALAAPPTGWLFCDGAAVPAGYPQLLALMPNTPDLRGRVPVGPDGAAGRLDALDALGNAGGEQKHTLSVTEMPAHAHAAKGAGIALPAGGANEFITPIGPDTNAAGNPILNNGGGLSHNNMQPYLVLNFIIRAA